MPLPSQLVPTTCDIYRGNPPGASPAATNLSCQLVPDYAASAQRANGDFKTWTHYVVLDSSVDVRDGYGGHHQPWQYQGADTLFIPAGGTTSYAVIFVEVRGKGTAGEHKRVYVDRQAPNWPAL